MQNFPRRTLAVFFTFAALSLTANFARADDTADVPKLMAAGQRAYNAGDLETAALDFQTVLQSQPRNQVAIAFLRRIAIAKQHSSGSIEAALQQIIVPKVDLKDASLNSVFPYLTQLTVKLSGGKVHPNFVISVPKETLESTKITLSLADISIADVIKYVGQLANLEFRYQPNAILVTQPTATPATKPVSGAAQ